MYCVRCFKRCGIKWFVIDEHGDCGVCQAARKTGTPVAS